jgi:Cu/Ag efflux protein CusF
MNKLLLTPLLAAVFAIAIDGSALARSKADDSAPRLAASTVAAKDDMTAGEIRRVDKGAGTITITHGEIKNIGMPPMTMVFRAKTAALLDKVKVGDKVRFRAEQTAAGVLLVTEIQPSGARL